MASMSFNAEGNAAFLGVNPIAKILFAVLLGIAAFLSDSFPFLFALLFFELCLGFASGLGGRMAALVGASVVAAAFLFALQLVFVRAGEEVLLFVTDQGIRTAGLVTLRLVDATIPIALAFLLTNLEDLANACVKTARLPYPYAFALTTALRFVPVFTKEMAATMEAQTSRGVEFDTRNPFRKIRLMLPLCAPLLVASVGRADSAALAAEQRGFHLRTRERIRGDYGLSATDFAIISAGVAIAVLAAIAG